MAVLIKIRPKGGHIKQTYRRNEMIKNEDELFSFLDQLPKECGEEVGASGPVDEIVAYWVESTGFAVEAEFGREYVSSFGVENTESMNNRELAEYILWIRADYAQESSE